MRERHPYRAVQPWTISAVRTVTGLLVTCLFIAGITQLAVPGMWTAVFDRLPVHPNLMGVTALIQLVAAALMLSRGRALGAALAAFLFSGAAIVYIAAGFWSASLGFAAVTILCAWLAWIDRPQSLGTSWPDRSVTG
jgi:hypothetical protein